MFLFGLGLMLLLSMMSTGAANRVAFLVSVDIEVGRDSNARLYWNDFAQGAVVRATSGNIRQTLEFAVPPVSLNRLRFDPTEFAAEDVTVYGIAIRRLGDGTITNLSPETIASWPALNVTDVRLVPESVTYRTVTNGAFIDGPVDIAVPWSDTLVNLVARYLPSQTLIAQLVVFGALMVALTALNWKRLPLVLLAGSAPLFFLYFAESTFDFLGITTKYDVANSVGHAALRGASVDAARWGSLVAALLSLGFGLACAFWFRDSDLRRDADAPARRAPRWAENAVVFGWLGVLVLYMSPDLAAILRTTATQSLVPGWDFNNGHLWAGLVARGDMPPAAFWYPYGGLWLFYYSPVPFGPLVRWGYMVALYWVTGVAIWRLVRHRFGLFGFALSALVILFAEAGLLNQPERYLVAVAVALAFAAIDRRSALGHSGRVWFWIACLLALAGETLQLAYAALPVLAVLILTELPMRRAGWWDVLKRFVADFSVPAAGAVGLVLLHLWRGELASVVQTYLEASGHWTYSVIPTGLRSEFALTNIVSAAVIGTYFLLFLAAIFSLRRNQPDDSRIVHAILSCAVIALIVFQKHWLRPVGAQLFESVIIGALLVVPLFWNRVRGRAVAAFFGGALVFALFANPAMLGAARDRLAGAPSRLASTLGTLAGDWQSIETANREAFAQPRFARFTEELPVIARLRELGEPSLFVQGDMPIFYLFSTGPVPFQMNQFSMSPIRSQEVVAKWLEETRPEIAIVDTQNSLTFDDIQYVVRVPVVAIEAMLRYVPREKVGSYYLLDRRSGDQPVALAFWESIYGSAVNYGHILQYSTVGDLPACASPATECARFLEISFTSEIADAQSVTLPVAVGGSEFQVSFIRIPGLQRYFIPLDRLWFWVLGEAMGLAPEVRPGADLSVQQIQKRSARPMLY